MATDENIEAAEGEEIVEEEVLTPEDQAREQLDFDDPEDDIQQEQLQDYIEERTSEHEQEDLEDDVDHSDFAYEDLVDRALDVGLEPEDIDELGSVDAIENYIKIAERQMSEVEEDEEEERPDFSLDYELPEDTPISKSLSC